MEEETKMEYDKNLGLNENIRRMCESKGAYADFEWSATRGEDGDHYGVEDMNKHQYKAYKLGDELYVYEHYKNNSLVSKKIWDREIPLETLKDSYYKEIRLPMHMEINPFGDALLLTVTKGYNTEIFCRRLSKYDQASDKEKEYTAGEFRRKLLNDITSGTYDEMKAADFYDKIIKSLKAVKIQQKNDEPTNERSEEQETASSFNEPINEKPEKQEIVSSFDEPTNEIEQSSEQHEQEKENEDKLDKELDGLSTEELEDRLSAINEENKEKQNAIEKSRRNLLKNQIRKAMAEGNELDNQLAQLRGNTQEL